MEVERAIVIGADGFVGWPLTLRLSNLGVEVLVIDNLSRRAIDRELGSQSITPIESIETRIQKWKELTNKNIGFQNINVAKDYDSLKEAIETFRPNTIFHLGAQRSAPYSMKNSTTRRFTTDNNVNATSNILNAIVDVDRSIHLVHIGTMGVYGYGSVPETVIPEGYIQVKIKNKQEEDVPVEILHPSYPGSIYHLAKTQDALMFQFFAKNYKLKITDLHQGIIWGVNTKETSMDIALINRMDSDGDYGTVLNRFIIQASCGEPLTVYGRGGQTRAFIHIENSMDCLILAMNNPPNQGDKVKIFNQMTETRNIKQLAELIKENFPEVVISFLDNPRNELIENELEVSNKQFLDLKLVPIFIDKIYLGEIFEMVKMFDKRLLRDLVQPLSFWK
jgi:UDP-sulfoquinovose synthase